MAHGAFGQAVAEALVITHTHTSTPQQHLLLTPSPLCTQAGATGGLVVVTLLAPLDLVKVRLQARLKAAAAPQDGSSHGGTPTALAVLKVTTPQAPPTPPSNKLTIHTGGTV